MSTPTLTAKAGTESNRLGWASRCQGGVLRESKTQERTLSAVRIGLVIYCAGVLITPVATRIFLTMPHKIMIADTNAVAATIIASIAWVRLVKSSAVTVQ